jgi:hypothetical protein
MERSYGLPYTRTVGINAKAVVRVIIEGEWIWVERGTFTLMPLEFVDDLDNPLNPSREPVPAYFFVSTQGDPYFGPLGSISLFKLDTQLLEETESGPPARGRPHELGQGTGETFGGEVGPRAAPVSDEPASDEPPGEAPAAKKPVPLFADDVEDDADFAPSERRRGGGLF